MNILELAILKKMVGGGGGSGTDNYNDLSNLPQINGETLAGNKTAENLGLQDALTFDDTPTEDSTNPVESGGVYNALAGKQDNLTFDDDPTENSTNPVKSGGVYSALAGKQDNLTFDGVYNASTNKAATESTVTNAIAGLDVSAFSVDADETISSISETDGKVSVTKQDIAIASNQVVAMTGYTKPSSAPATPAIQTSDTANQAFGKLEFKADTNQSNILYVADRTSKNVLRTPIAYETGYSATIKGITFTVQDDYSVKVNGTCTASTGDYSTFVITSSNFHADDNYGHEISGFILNGCPNLNGDLWIAIERSDSPYTSYGLDNGSNASGVTINNIPTNINVLIFIRVPSGKTINNAVVYPMIRPAFTDSTYQPPALPNYDLTRLEAEDRASLAEVVDSGAKNVLKISGIDTSNANGVTYTLNSDGSITVNGTPSGTADSYITMSSPTNYVTWCDGKHYLSGCPKGGNLDTKYALYFIQGGYRPTDEGDGVLLTPTTASSLNLVINVRNGFTANNLVFKPMICTKAAFGVSPKFVAYKPTSQILVTSKTNFTTSTGTTLQDTGVSYTIPSDGIYRITASLTYGTGMPTEIAIVNSANEGMIYDRAVPPTSTNVMGLTAQTVIAASSGAVKVRAKFEIANASAPVSLIVEKIG